MIGEGHQLLGAKSHFARLRLRLASKPAHTPRMPNWEFSRTRLRLGCPHGTPYLAHALVHLHGVRQIDFDAGLTRADLNTMQASLAAASTIGAATVR